MKSVRIEDRTAELLERYHKQLSEALEAQGLPKITKASDAIHKALHDALELGTTDATRAPAGDHAYARQEKKSFFTLRTGLASDSVPPPSSLSLDPFSPHVQSDEDMDRRGDPRGEGRKRVSLPNFSADTIADELSKPSEASDSDHGNADTEQASDGAFELSATTDSSVPKKRRPVADLKQSEIDARIIRIADRWGVARSEVTTMIVDMADAIAKDDDLVVSKPYDTATSMCLDMPSGADPVREVHRAGDWLRKKNQVRVHGNAFLLKWARKVRVDVFAQRNDPDVNPNVQQGMDPRVWDNMSEEAKRFVRGDY